MESRSCPILSLMSFLAVLVLMSVSIPSCTIQKSQLVPDLFCAEKQVSVYRMTESTSTYYNNDPVYLIIRYHTAELTAGNCSLFYRLEFQNDTINLREHCSIIDGKIIVPNDENAASTSCLIFLENGRILKGLDKSSSSELSGSEIVDSMEDLITGSCFTIVPYVLPSEKVMEKCLDGSQSCFPPGHIPESVADNDINIYVQLRSKYDYMPHFYGSFEPFYFIIRNNKAEMTDKYFSVLFEVSHCQDTLIIKKPYDIFRRTFLDLHEYEFLKKDNGAILVDVTDYPDSLQLKINDNESIVYENPEKEEKYRSYVKLNPSNRRRDLSRKISFNVDPFRPFD